MPETTAVLSISILALMSDCAKQFTVVPMPQPGHQMGLSSLLKTWGVSWVGAFMASSQLLLVPRDSSRATTSAGWKGFAPLLQ